MDHTPSIEMMESEKISRLARRKKLTIDQARNFIEEGINTPRITIGQIEDLTKYLISKNIPIASHDDSSIAQVEYNHAIGMNICEFPINLETAKKAVDLGLYSVGGASNLLRGGSNIGNLSVMDAINENAINVLCSDYYPPSILHSIFLLMEKGVKTLSEASKLASLNAAKAAKLDLCKGSIEIGKDADLVLVDYSQAMATISATIVSGNISGQYQLKHP